MITNTRRHQIPAYPFVVTPSMETDDEDMLILVVPDLPGCMTHAASSADILPRVQDAIDSWVLHAESEGMEIPTPGSSIQGIPDWARDAVFPTLSTSDVAEILGVSARRVRALAESRKVGRIVGNSLMFFPDEVEAMKVRLPGRPRAVV